MYAYKHRKTVTTLWVAYELVNIFILHIRWSYNTYTTSCISLLPPVDVDGWILKAQCCIAGTHKHEHTRTHVRTIDGISYLVCAYAQCNISISNESNEQSALGIKYRKNSAAYRTIDVIVLFFLSPVNAFSSDIHICMRCALTNVTAHRCGWKIKVKPPCGARYHHRNAILVKCMHLIWPHNHCLHSAIDISRAWVNYMYPMLLHYSTHKSNYRTTFAPRVMNEPCSALLFFLHLLFGECSYSCTTFFLPCISSHFGSDKRTTTVEEDRFCSFLMFNLTQIKCHLR